MVFRDVAERVLGSKGGWGGERGQQLTGRGVSRLGAASDPEGDKVPSVPAIGDDGGKAGLVGKNGGGCGEEVVRCPSRDPVPEAFYGPEHRGVLGEQVCPVGEYGEEEAVGDAVA